MPSSGQCIQWRNLFVVVDDGRISMPRYDDIEAAMTALARKSPRGMACLVILPANAKPPPEATRKRIDELLGRLAPRLNSLAYIVEGTGFTAAAARATLIGFKVFSRKPYPIYVETKLRTTLAKLMTHLDVEAASPAVLDSAEMAISDERSASTQASFVVTSRAS